MNDIAVRATELIAHLTKNGFNDFDVPDACVSNEESWSEHFACIGDLAVDYYDAAEEAGGYFDYAQLEYDFDIMLRDWFTFDGEETKMIRSHEKTRDSELDSKNGLIVVRYQRGCDELEVYRLVNGVIPGDDES